MITMILKAATALGFGSPDFYKEKVKVEDNPDSIRQAMVNFALKNGVELSSIQMEIVS